MFFRVWWWQIIRQADWPNVDIKLNILIRLQNADIVYNSSLSDFVFFVTFDGLYRISFFCRHLSELKILVLQQELRNWRHSRPSQRSNEPQWEWSVYEWLIRRRNDRLCRSRRKKASRCVDANPLSQVFHQFLSEKPNNNYQAFLDYDNIYTKKVYSYCLQW